MILQPNESASRLVERYQLDPETVQLIWHILATGFILALVWFLVSEFVHGIPYRLRKSDFNEDELIRLNRREWLRIQKLGFIRVKFTVFVYRRKLDGTALPLGGYTRYYTYTRLDQLDIDKPLEKITEEQLKDIMEQEYYAKQLFQADMRPKGDVSA
jgi:hypothetical protein